MHYERRRKKSVCKKKEQGSGAYSQTDKICFDCVGNTDFAVYYGCYPIQLLEYEDGREIQTFKIHDPDAINQWGLLKDQASCDKYMEINTNEVEMVVNGIHYKMEWEARAVYCDHYTYAKLIKAYNDLV